MTDLHGEGIPGILTEQAGAWFYKRNLSPIPVKLPDGSEVVKAKFSALETVALKPNITLNGADFMELAGDGQPDVVVTEGPTPGLYEHDDADGWQPFRPFTARLAGLAERNFPTAVPEVWRRGAHHRLHYRSAGRAPDPRALGRTDLTAAPGAGSRPTAVGHARCRAARLRPPGSTGAGLRIRSAHRVVRTA